MSAADFDVLDLIEHAPQKIFAPRFESEGESFGLELTAYSRADIQKIRQKGIKRIFDRKNREYRDEVDDDKIQAQLADAIQSWSGLTGNKLATFCRRNPNVSIDGRREILDRELPCDPRTKAFMLKYAVCVREGGGMLGFADWVFEQLTGAAEEMAVIEQKKETG